MSAKKKIMALLNRRKTGMTSFDLYDRLPDLSGKTIRNNLGMLLADGVVEHDEFQYLHEDRYVTAYRAA